MPSFSQSTVPTRIHISSIIIDDPVIPKIIVTISDDTKHKIELTMTRNRNSDFFGYVDFFLNEFRLSTSPGSYQNFNNDIFCAMIEKYEDYIVDLSKA